MTNNVIIDLSSTAHCQFDNAEILFVDGLVWLLDDDEDDDDDDDGNVATYIACLLCIGVILLNKFNSIQHTYESTHNIGRHTRTPTQALRPTHARTQACATHARKLAPRTQARTQIVFILYNGGIFDFSKGDTVSKVVFQAHIE